MMDDPRQILSEAGVECAEVEHHHALREKKPMPWEMSFDLRVADAAILALARLVAHWKDAAQMRHEDAECYEAERDKYKWQRDEGIEDALSWMWTGDGCPKQEIIADLDRRWKERDG
jgi:hypothetical protein